MFHFSASSKVYAKLPSDRTCFFALHAIPKQTDLWERVTECIGKLPKK